MNFLEAQRPLLVILKLFGFFTYSINSEAVPKMFHFIHCVIVNIFCHGAFIGIHFYFVMTVGNYIGDDNDATQFVTKLEGYTIGFSFLIIFYSVFFETSSQIEFIENLLIIESEIVALKFTRINNANQLRRKILLKIFSFSFFYAFMFFYSCIVVPRQHFLLLILEIFYYCFFLIYQLFIVTFLHNIVSTMERMLDELSWNLKHCIPLCPFPFHKDQVNKILKLHDRILEAIPLFNKSFGVIVFGNYMFIMGLVTFEMYFGFSAFFKSTVFSGLTDLFLNITGNIVCYVPLFVCFSLLGFTCENVQEKVEEFLCYERLIILVIPGHGTDVPLEDRFMFIMRSTEGLSPPISLMCLFSHFSTFSKFIAFPYTRSMCKRTSPPTTFSISTMQCATM